MAPSRALRKTASTLQLSRGYEITPAGIRWRSHTLFILATVAVGMFTDLFLYGLIVPVMPYLLQERIGIPSSEVQSYTSWLLALYAGAQIIISPLAGIFADRISTRQAPFLAGLAALLVATVLFAVATTVPLLAVARVLQGTSAALVWTIGLTMCLETVGPQNLGKAIGTIFSIISVGALWGPVLGGVLYRRTGYTGVFGLGAGVLALDFIMRLLVIEKKVASRYPEFSQSSKVSDDSLEEGAEQDEAASTDESSPLLRRSSQQLREQETYRIGPLQPNWLSKVPILVCFRNPSLLSAMLVAFVQATLLASFDATVPTTASSYFGFDSLKSGLLFLPIGVPDLVVGPIAGWAVDRFGTKPISVTFYTFLVPVLILLRLPHEGGKPQIIIYSVLLAFCGVGISGIGAPSIVEAGAVVEKYHKANPEFFGEQGPYAQLYGINSMVFSAGLTLGPLIAGGLKDSIGYGNMNAVLAAICAVTAALCFLYIGGRPRMVRRWGL